MIQFEFRLRKQNRERVKTVEVFKSAKNVQSLTGVLL